MKEEAGQDGALAGLREKVNQLMKDLVKARLRCAKRRRQQGGETAGDVARDESNVTSSLRRVVALLEEEIQAARAEMPARECGRWRLPSKLLAPPATTSRQYLERSGSVWFQKKKKCVRSVPSKAGGD